MVLTQQLFTTSGLSRSAALLLADIAEEQTYSKSRQDTANELGIHVKYVSNLFKTLLSKGYVKIISSKAHKNFYALTEKAQEFFQRKTQKQQKKTCCISKTPSVASQEAIPAPSKPKTTDVAKELEEAHENASKRELLQQIHRTLEGERRILETPGRLRKLNARLKVFTPNQILDAAYNLSQSRFHMGENDAHVKYATVDFLLRNDEQVEKWLYSDIQTRYAKKIIERIV